MDPLIEELGLYNLKAEREIIGGLLMDYEDHAFQMVKKYRVNSGWFYDTMNRRFGAILLDMVKHNHPTTPASIAEYMTRTKSLLPITTSDLTAYMDSFTTLAHYEFHLNILQNLYYKREMLNAAADFPDQISGEAEPHELISEFKHQLDLILDDEPNKVRSPEEIKAAITEMHTTADKTGAMGVPTRWSKIQAITGGWPKGKLSVVAARPSIGKTTLSLNDTRFIAGEGGHTVGWLSLDDDEEDLYMTMAGEQAEVDLMKFKQGRASQDEHVYFNRALDSILRLPIHVSDQKMTIDHICNWIQYMNDKRGLSIVFLDFIQIIRPNDFMQRWSDKQKVTYWSHELKRISKVTKTSVVALSQLNRGGEMPPEVKPEQAWRYVPRLKHLKEAGAIEEDADLVLILYNDPMKPNAQNLTNVPLVIDVAKNKKGRKGQEILTYRKDKQRIEQRTFDG